MKKDLCILLSLTMVILLFSSCDINMNINTDSVNSSSKITSNTADTSSKTTSSKKSASNNSSKNKKSTKKNTKNTAANKSKKQKNSNTTVVSSPWSKDDLDSIQYSDNDFIIPPEYNPSPELGKVSVSEFVNLLQPSLLTVNKRLSIGNRFIKSYAKGTRMVCEVYYLDTNILSFSNEELENLKSGISNYWQKRIEEYYEAYKKQRIYNLTGIDLIYFDKNDKMFLTLKTK